MLIDALATVLAPGGRRVDGLARAAPSLALSLTFVILGVLALGTAALLPIAGRAVFEMPGINALFASGVFVADLATAVLLFLRFRHTGSTAVLLLVVAYGLSALLAIGYCVTFPGAMRDAQPLVGTPISVSWVFTTWMTAYPALSLLAVLAPPRARSDGAAGMMASWPVLPAALVVLAAVAVLVLALRDDSALPLLVGGGRWTVWDLLLSYFGSGALLVGTLVILATPRRRDELMQWLSLALFTMACGNLLSTVGGGRYSVGWYAFRLSWFASSCVLFLYFMVQFARQQAQLARTVESLQERTRERDRIWYVSEDLLGVATVDGRFVAVNPAWTRTLGWSADELHVMSVDQLRHPDDAPVTMPVRDEVAGGRTTVRVENRFRHKDGSWRWMAWNMTGERGQIYFAGRHITHEKEAEEERLKSEIARAHSQKIEALGQLTGGVAHDFNNLLMIVGGHIGRLKEAVARDPRAHRAAEAIETAARRGEALTRQLLRFSRRQPTNPDIVDLGKRVESLRPMLTSSLGNAIGLEIAMPADLWPVRVDPDEFDLAVVNLVLNARDALPQGGTIRIAAQNEQQGETAMVALAIADTGTGIAPDILPRVFDPFFTTKQTGKGTGLGLSQVHGFAHQSGGSVAIDSALDKGTTVTLRLPRGEAVAAAAVPRAAGESPGGQALLVEDNPNVAEVTREMLGILGYEVWLAGDAATALEIIDARRFDLVVSDIVMAGAMNGVDFARRLRQERPEQPILLVTGYSESAESAMAEFTVLRKPYRCAELRQAIGRVVAGGARAADGSWVER